VLQFETFAVPRIVPAIGTVTRSAAPPTRPLRR